MKHWRTLRKPIPNLAPARWFSWLNDNGSLTKRLTQLSGDAFSVQVDKNALEFPRPDEYLALGVGARKLCIIREVTLKGQGIPWVNARTVIPVDSLCGPQRALRRLGNKSLGSHLFTSASMRRGAITIAQTNDAKWARRSVFWLNNRPLLVCEVFLPALLGVK